MDETLSTKNLGRGYSIQSKKLKKLNLYTVSDLLYHLPHRYEDYRNKRHIKGLQLGELVTIQGEVVSFKNEYRSRRFTMQKMVVSDGTGEIEARWFNQNFLLRMFSVGDTISISGTIEMYGRTKCIQVKEYETIDESGKTIHTGKLIPIYPLTRGLSSKWLRTKISDFLHIPSLEIPEFLPETLLLSHKFPDLKTAFLNVHIPSNFEEVSIAKRRLSYEELFLLQMGAFLRRKEWEKRKKAPVFEILKFQDKIEMLFESLPFTLTTAQNKALDDMYADITKSVPMNRLLEGDVGSGKTVVAAIVLYLAVLNGHQGIFMAPTEILANQHYEVLKQLLAPLGVRIGLITGSTRKHLNQEARSRKNEEIRGSKLMIHNSFDIAVGTHAILHSKMDMSKLGLVVIDEQQRFGVEQRAFLRDQGKLTPHFLSMTATPIPRTVFLTLYGDLSLSVLDEMPKGRIKVKTWLVPNEKRLAGYAWIKKKILEVDKEGNKNQVFIICPFIEEKKEDEDFNPEKILQETNVTVKAATKEYERLKKEVFQDFTVGLVHGKMKSSEKDTVLKDFAVGNIDVLVATPVVEVGIDIPNATIMVIEDADRFGLASLHQLRGRVGRRSRESFCLLYTQATSKEAKERLKSLEKIYVGAELAELDLKLRGPGEMYGTEQSGAHALKIASFSDLKLILESRLDAEKMYPHLSEYPQLQQKVEEILNSQKILPD